jgi:hypothetical protein
MILLLYSSRSRSEVHYIPSTFSLRFTHSNSLPWTIGTSVEVKYLALYGADVVYSIDSTQGNVTAKLLGGDDVYNQTLVELKGLSNDQHTLRVEILSRPSSLLV